MTGDDDIGDYFRARFIGPPDQTGDWPAFNDILQNHVEADPDPRFEPIVKKLLVDFPHVDVEKILAAFLEGVWGDDYIIAWRQWDELREYLSEQAKGEAK